LHLWLTVQNCGISKRLVTNLIKGITCIRNEFAKENLLVGVKGVDDQRKELVNVSREGVAFCLSTLSTTATRKTNGKRDKIENEIYRPNSNATTTCPRVAFKVS